MISPDRTSRPRAPRLLARLLARRPAPLAALLTLAGLAGALWGCEEWGCEGRRERAAATERAQEEERRPWVLVASSYPLYDLARELTRGAEGVEVHLATPPGEDPASWAPSDEALALYQRADLVVLNGASFESWEPLVSLPPSRTLHAARGFEGRWLRYEEQTTHTHGPGGAHSHEGVDGHTWLDPLLAAEQAAAIAEEVARARPALAGAVRQNLARLKGALEELSGEWAALAPALRARRLLAAHPAYNYLKRRHALPLVSLDLNPDAPPSAEQRRAVEGLLSAPRGAEGAPEALGEALLWWESPPSAAAREGLRGLPLRHVVVSPVESAPEEGGYLAAARANVQRVREALTAAPEVTP